jgi:hypothetical protein
LDETTLLRGIDTTNRLSTDGLGGLAESALNIEDITNGKPFLQLIKEEDEREN